MREALLCLRISRRTLYNWIDMKKIKVFKSVGGREIFIPFSEIERIENE
jgi:predicted site-specific integrase-resolvase